MQNRRSFLGALARIVAAGSVVAASKASDQDVTDFGRNFYDASIRAFNNKTPRRMACLKVSNKLLEALLPAGTVLDLPNSIGEQDFSWLEKALLFPPGVKILAVSQHCFFCENMTAFKLAGPDFPEVYEGDLVQVVDAVYTTDDDGVARFVRWESVSPIEPKFKTQPVDSTWSLTVNDVRKIRGRATFVLNP